MQANPNDAVIVSTARTALTKSFRGSFNDTEAPVLGGHVVRAVVERAGIEPGAVEDVIMGAAVQQGTQAYNIGRLCAYTGGLPDTVPGMALDRMCASGLMTIGVAAKGIMTGELSVAVAGGVESLSLTQTKHKNSYRAQRSAVFPEDGLGGGPTAHGGLGPFQRLGQGGADRVALFSQVNGRLQHMLQRQRAPLLQGVGQARHGAGHANGMVGVERFAVDHLALGIQVHAALGAGRGSFTKIQRHALAAGRLMHQHEAATANVARVGQGHSQGKAHGYGGIHGVASGLEHL